MIRRWLGRSSTPWPRDLKNRPGGYTRTVKIGLRRGDNAPLSLIEIIPEAEALKAEPSTTEGKAKGKPTTRKRRPRKKTEPGAAA